MKLILKTAAVIFIIAQLGILVVSCTPEKKKESKSKSERKKSTKKNGLVQSHYEDGTLRAEINYKDGKKEGIAREYYQDGVLFQEINYRAGIKEGEAKRFHKNGKLYQSTQYVKGKMQGKQLKFREDGKQASEAIFIQDMPCTGLIEYTLKGDIKKKYPSIVITPVNTLLRDNKYILKLSMSEKVVGVEYFSGTLTKEGCLGDGAEKVYLNSQNNTGEVVFYLPPGNFLMEKVNVIAKVKTLQGNYYLTQKSFNVAIENN